MFGGIAFMVNDKMCLGVDKEDIMLRCTPEMSDTLISKKGVRLFDLTGKPMKGWLLISPDGIKTQKDFDAWVKFALDENKKVAETKKSKK
jgi:hypothetical protein